MLLWVFFLAFSAALYVGWPMNEQLPNVALVGLSYLFTLAQGTYGSSSNGAVAYEASGLPSWLQFDGSSRTFSGTPSSSDIGTFQITLQGTDSNDKLTLSNSYLMLVASSQPIKLSSPDVMFTTIAKYGQTNGEDGLVVRPGQQFSIQFSKNTFNPAEAVKAYYGRSQDRTPLPNWVNFDPDSLTFSGTVPQVVSSIAPSFSYNFCFIAADQPGYASAVGTFNLVVGAHLLSTSFTEPVKFNGTLGSALNETVPVLSSVFLDQQPILQQNISAVYLQDAPSFVTLGDQYKLSGTFPNSTTAANFSVVVKDVFGNSVNLPYQISSYGSLFTVSSLPDANATRGQFFLLQLSKTYFTEYNSSKIDVLSNSSWLSYESSNMTLLGNAPGDLLQALVSVKASQGNLNDELSFVIRGVDAVTRSSSSALSSRTSSSSSMSSSSSSSSPSRTAQATATATSTTLSVPQSGNTNKKNLIIGLVTGIVGALLFALLGLLLFCCFRKRHDDEDDEKRSASPTEPELTGPGFGTTYDLDDHNEIARQLGALNAMKLDADNESDILCETHVDSEEENVAYLDERGKPTKSWRANDMSDSSAVKKMLLEQHRRSDMSLNTINTEQLFSVRVVDDNNSNRVSRQSILGDLTRDTSSANVLRLDSDGNIAEGNDLVKTSGSKDHLLNTVEESPNTTNQTQASSIYSLMAKLDNHEDMQRDPSFGQYSQNSLGDAFKHSAPTDSDIMHWKNEDYVDASSSMTKTSEINPKSTTKAYFPTDSPLNSPLGNLHFEEDRKAYKAKLVDFTRKGSLKDSSREQRQEFSATEGQILDDGDSLT